VHDHSAVLGLGAIAVILTSERQALAMEIAAITIASAGHVRLDAIMASPD